MQSRSQAGQDLFVHAVTRKHNGTFLEIGGFHPININNTFALEQMGWSGFSFDIDAKLAKLFAEQRQCKFVVADVTKFDWEQFLQEHDLQNKTMDFLSFDVDEASLPTLRRFPFNKLKFNVMTVEHDKYRFGQKVADEMRALILPHGYDLLCKDIQNDNCPFEDWYVHRDFVAENPHVERFRCSNVNWKHVINQINSS